MLGRGLQPEPGEISMLGTMVVEMNIEEIQRKG